MTIGLRDMVGHAWFTVQQPQPGARRVLELGLPRDVAWQCLAAVVLVSVVLGEGFGILAGALGGRQALGVFGPPFMMAGIQFALMAVMALAIYYVGRALGGTGDFGGAVILLAWLQFILVCLQMVQFLLMAVLPLLAWLVGFGGIILFFYLLTHFVAVLHGFRDIGRVFVMIMLTLVGLTLGMSVLLALIGVQVSGIS